MKRFLPLLLVLASCLGTKARENGLLPPMRAAWAGVRVDVQTGIDDAHLADPSAIMSAVVSLDSAIQTGDVVALSVAPWTAIEPYGQRGIDVYLRNGDIGPMGAGSFRERLRQFGLALNKFKVVTP